MDWQEKAFLTSMCAYETKNRNVFVYKSLNAHSAALADNAPDIERFFFSEATVYPVSVSHTNC